MEMTHVQLAFVFQALIHGTCLASFVIRGFSSSLASHQAAVKCDGARYESPRVLPMLNESRSVSTNGASVGRGHHCSTDSPSELCVTVFRK